MQKLDRALLVAAHYQTTYDETLSSVLELEALAQACHIKPVDKVIQSIEKVNPKYFIGQGKVFEIKQMIDLLDIDIIIFDDTLSPAQLRNLEIILDTQIVDRSFLILQIFAQRAKTKQAILEISLAQKLYMLPRLVGMRNSLSRQGGSSFNAKGPGETKLELDKRKITEDISHLKRALKSLKRKRVTSSKRRVDKRLPIVALVGYTNAGKSALMNALVEKYGQHKEKVFEENMLFATLDTKAKRIKKDNQAPFILIDTVGFISKLPPELIASFESTLADIMDADLILHVVDGLNPHLNQIEFTRSILKKLGLENTPRLLVVTKKDLRTDYPHIIEDYHYISNQTHEGIEFLYQSIQAYIYPESRLTHLLIPFVDGYLFSRLKEETTIIESNYREDGIYIKAVLTPKLITHFKPYIIPSNSI